MIQITIEREADFSGDFQMEYKCPHCCLTLYMFIMENEPGSVQYDSVLWHSGMWGPAYFKCRYCHKPIPEVHPLPGSPNFRRKWHRL